MTGLARVVRDVRLDRQQFKLIAGLSVKYSAPEVFARATLCTVPSEAVDRAGDVFAYGVIVWELMARRPAWQGVSPPDVQSRVIAGERPEWSAVAKMDSKAGKLRDVVIGCWQQAHDKRPTFAEILAALKKI